MRNLVKLSTIMVEQMGVRREDVVPSAKISEDLGADSLDHVELIMAIEEEWGTKIPDHESDRLVTVGDILNLLAERGLA